MRLLRSKIYRAFPELDRFGDEQCQRFIVAANASWRRRVVRWMLEGCVALLFTALAIAVPVALGAWLDRPPTVATAGRAVGGGWASGHEPWFVAAYVPVCIALVGSPFLSMLIARDILLRRAVRRLIRRCGSCPRCRYSLLGMRVGAENVIVCPECGTRVVADPAMGELTTDETGAAVYKPEVARDDELARERQRRRHRRFLRWAAVGTAALVLVLVMGAVGYWVHLERQAKRAIADRNTAAAIAKVRATLAPEGVLVGHDGAAEWGMYVELVRLSQTEMKRLMSDEKYRSAGGRDMYFEYSTLLPTFDAKDTDRRVGEGSAGAMVRYTLDTLAHARESGVDARLRGLLELKDPERPIVMPPAGMYVMAMFDGLAESRGLARFNAGRMVLAMRKGERTEYVEALEESLAAARIVERQGSLIEKLVAVAIRSLVFKRIQEDIGSYPDGRWAEDVLAAVKRQTRRVPMSAMLEYERIGGLDAIQYVFSDPKLVAKAQFGLGGADPFGWGLSGPGLGLPRIGTYEGNRDALNGMYDAMIAASVEDRSKRGPGSSGVTGYAIVDTLTPALSRAIQSDDVGEFDRRRCVVTLAAEVFARNNGRSPATVDELGEIMGDAKEGLDPYTGKPFQIAVNPATGKGEKAFVVLDGNGNEPVEPGAKKKPAPKK